MGVRFLRAFLFAVLYALICPAPWWPLLFTGGWAAINIAGYTNPWWLLWVWWASISFPFGLLLKNECDKFRWWTVMLIAVCVYVIYCFIKAWYYPQPDDPDDIKMAKFHGHLIVTVGSGWLFIPIAILCVWPAVWLSGQPFVIYKRYKATGRWTAD